MRKGKALSRTTRALALLGGGGVMFATSCSAGEVQAVLVGLDAFAQSLNDSNEPDDLNFGDWLLNELQD